MSETTSTSGAERGRPEAFSDGVFAIAVTLLILEVTVSDEGGTWINHHNMLQVVHRMDHTILAAIWFPMLSLAVFGALAVFYLLPQRT